MEVFETMKANDFRGKVIGALEWQLSGKYFNLKEDHIVVFTVCFEFNCETG